MKAVEMIHGTRPVSFKHNPSIFKEGRYELKSEKCFRTLA